MKFKPYFYYRQQYSQLNKSCDDSNNSSENDNKEAAGETNGDDGIVKKTTGAEPGKNEIQKPEVKYEHSRFKEIGPGIFQFKHPRPNTVWYPPVPAANLNEPDKRIRLDEFVRIGTFPGACGHGLPVYQFT